jgi:alpha,alpha-trehalose-phosphate synthase [UDP-forming]/trehalose-phosphatase
MAQRLLLLALIALLAGGAGGRASEGGSTAAGPTAPRGAPAPAPPAPRAPPRLAGGDARAPRLDELTARELGRLSLRSPDAARQDGFIVRQIEDLATQLRAERARRAALQLGRIALTTQASPRVLLVANRLPFSLRPDETTAVAAAPALDEAMPPLGPAPSSAAAAAAAAAAAEPSSAAAAPAFELVESSGGLVSALVGVRRLEMLWVGWPGADEPPTPARAAAVRAELGLRGCVPVFLRPLVQSLFYSGFCNGLLWPMLHSLLTAMVDNAALDSAQWSAYVEANRAFADATLAVLRPGDVVWVHDFHLMLLPAMLRARAPKGTKIGWFLHTPFPAPDVFRTLPMRRELLEGLLGADLLGFQTPDNVANFLNAAQRTLGLAVKRSADTSQLLYTARGREATEDGGPPASGASAQAAHAASADGARAVAAARAADAAAPPAPDGEASPARVRSICIDSFPIGIDPSRFEAALASPAVVAQIADLRARFAGKRVLLGIDRLDPIKGLPHKLLAMEAFLSAHPEWIGKVVLLQIAIPSRSDVAAYRRLRESVHALVGRINGRFGSASDSAIHYLDRSVPFDELCALYRLADVALVSSLRDGMNLVSFEYVACQQGKGAHGVLVLSEFCGAAQALGAGALLVNPYDADDVARAIHAALTMGAAQRAELHAYAHAYVSKHTNQAWAEKFVTELALDDAPAAAAVPPRLDAAAVATAYAAASRRLIVLGVRGVLAPPLRAARASRDAPGADGGGGGGGAEGDAALTALQAQPLPGSARRLIHRLASDPRNEVVVISDMDRAWLDSQLSPPQLAAAAPRLWLLAENGGFARGQGNATWLPLLPAVAANLALAKAQAAAQQQQEGGGGGGGGGGGASGGGADAAADAAAADDAPAQPSAWREGWRESVWGVFRYYAERTPGALIEARESSLAWHYPPSGADGGLGGLHAASLVSHLEGLLANLPLEVLWDARAVSVRLCGVSKGAALDAVLAAMLRRRADADARADAAARPPTAAAAAAAADGAAAPAGAGGEPRLLFALAPPQAASPAAGGAPAAAGAGALAAPSPLAARALFDFVLAVADCAPQDDDLFACAHSHQALKGATVVSACVGERSSTASAYARSQPDAYELLRALDGLRAPRAEPRPPTTPPPPPPAAAAPPAPPSADAAAAAAAVLSGRRGARVTHTAAPPWSAEFGRRAGWATSATPALAASLSLQPARPARGQLDRMARAFGRGEAGRRCALFLDYDGTLRAFELEPSLAVPTAQLGALLGALAACEWLDVHIVSGRPAPFLEAHLGGYAAFTLVAEHGRSIKLPRRAGGAAVGPAARAFPFADAPAGGGWRPFLRAAAGDRWRAPVRALMAAACAAVEGSRLEEKEAALVWHYRAAAPPARALAGARALLARLAAAQAADALPIAVVHGAMIVEVAPADVHKGRAVEELLRYRAAEAADVADADAAAGAPRPARDGARAAARGRRAPRPARAGGAALGHPYARLLVAGDDRADEAMFAAVSACEQALTLRVGGTGPSLARYALSGPDDILALLAEIARTAHELATDERGAARAGAGAADGATAAPAPAPAAAPAAREYDREADDDDDDPVW